MQMMESSHRRFNPLLKKWVLVSPHRNQRPWQGEVITLKTAPQVSYDPQCYLCPGNGRANGQVNPDYSDTFSFVNDFPALLQIDEYETFAPDPLIRARSSGGICKVLCFSPLHNLTIAEMSQQDICYVIQQWKSESKELADRNEIEYVTIFENKGAMMGCSNPHPHGQIWASDFIPSTPLTSYTSQRDYFFQTGKSLINQYIAFEVSAKERIIFENSDWVSLVPFWAEWPYEVMIAPKTVIPSLCDLDDQLIQSWAEIFSQVTICFDNLFQTSFPYSMGIYQKPCDQDSWEGSCIYQVFLPPLLRSANIRKYMVGFEMISEAQRDLNPETAAATLRAQSKFHYRKML